MNIYDSEKDADSYLRGIAYYNEDHMNSEFKKVKLKFSKLNNLYLWLKQSGYSEEKDILKEAMPRPIGSLYDIRSGEYPSEEFSPEKIDDRDLKYMRSEAEEGDRVRWFGNKDRMVKVDTDYIYPIAGNIFYPTLIKKIEDGIRMATPKNKINLYCGYADVIKVDLNWIEEDLKYFDYGESDYTTGLSTGDEELDKYLKNKEEYLSDWKSNYDEETAEELLKEAVENQEGDIGKYIFQIREGNHRAFGAKNAGEKYIWVNIMTNKYNSLKLDEHGIYDNYSEIKRQLNLLCDFSKFLNNLKDEIQDENKIKIIDDFLIKNKKYNNKKDGDSDFCEMHKNYTLNGITDSLLDFLK